MPQTELGRRLELMLDQSEYRGNAKALSLAAGLGETAVRDIIEGRSQKPRFETLHRLAGKLKRPVEQLTGEHALDESAARAPFVGGEAARAPPRRAGGFRPDLIPIKSAGRGGTEQEMYLEVVGYTPRPATLQGVREAYAVYMVGDSMSPRYEPGWLLHINPFKPPTAGRAVVVYKKNNAVLIKVFKRRSTVEVILEQLNPPEEIRIPLEEIQEVHLIVGSDEEGR